MKKRFTKIISTLSEITELPLSEMCKEFTANMSGRREIVFDGVLSIDRYEDCQIILSLCGECVSICGKRLELKNFYKTSLCIRGNIEKVEFLCGDNK